MKKIALCFIMACLSLSFYPPQSNAANNSTTTSASVPTPKETEEAKTLLKRLDEIKAMDKSNLQPAERKQLRKEVRTIKNRLTDIGSGVYISVGGLILILILLIILF